MHSSTCARAHTHAHTQVVRYGKLHKYGLEAGSKPELLIALATMTNEGALVTCNGYKDSDYGVKYCCDICLAILICDVMLANRVWLCDLTIVFCAQ